MEVKQEVDIVDKNIGGEEEEMGIVQNAEAVKEEFGENVRVKQEPVVVKGAGVSVQNKVGHSREIKNTYQVMTRDERRGWRIRKRSGEFDEENLTLLRVKEENSDHDVGGAGGEVGELQMAGLNVGEGPRGAQEVETASSDDVEDNAVEVTDKGDLVLVQKNKYKWPAIIHGREATKVQVQLFNKEGLKGKLISVDQVDVTEFVYSDELASVVNSSNNNELKNAFKKALELFEFK